MIFHGSATRILRTGSVPMTKCDGRRKGLNAKRLHAAIIHAVFKIRPSELDWRNLGLHILLIVTPSHVVVRGKVC